MRSSVRSLLILVSCLLSYGVAFSQVLVRDIPAPASNSSALCWDGSAFWVGSSSGTGSNKLHKISIVDGTRLDSLTLPVNGSDGLAWDGSYLWSVSGASNRQRIYKIDTSTRTVIDSIPDPAAGQAGGMTWDGNYLWVSKYFPSNELLQVNSQNGVVLDSIAAFGNYRAYGLAYESGFIWTGSQDSTADVVYRIDVATDELNWQFELPEHASFPDRRLRGLSWVDGYLWLIAYAQQSSDVRLHQYDVSNALHPDIVVDTTVHDFGSLVVDFPGTWTLSGTNIGNSTLVLQDVSWLLGSGFRVTNNFPINVAPLAPFSLLVEFDPPSAGEFADTMFVESNDPDEDPLPIAVRGVGLANESDIDPQPSVVDFGEVWVPSPGLLSARTVELHNVGYGSLVITSVNILVQGAFRVDALSLPAVVDSQSYINLRVWFDPLTAGAYDGILSIQCNDPDESVVEIPLSGSALHADFEAGDIIWTYADQTDDFDVSINALTYIEDVNGDGTADVLAASGSGYTYCLNGSSSEFGDTLWSFDTRADPNHSGPVYYDRALAAISDITGDGAQDVILGTAGGSRSVYALSGTTGEELWMFDTEWWGDGGWVNAVEPTMDLNNDFVADVIVAGGDDGGSTGPRRLFALSGQAGTLIWEGPTFSSFYAIAAIADVNDDEVPDFVGGTSGWAVGVSGSDGALLWQSSIGSNSPVFDLENMGNANPEDGLSEDVAVASAYHGVYSIDGDTHEQIWLHPIDNTFVYELAVGNDITGDEIREVYVGLVSGQVLCLDGASGATVWDRTADPDSPENVLALEIVPDVTGDFIDDLICGTLGDYLVVMEGWDGERFMWTRGAQLFGAMDVVGSLPDIDNSGAWEILAGNRSGTVTCLSGGEIIDAAPEQPQLPTRFELTSIYPNPFNPGTTISYTVSTATHVRIQIFDVLGREVATLVNQLQQPGSYQASWTGSTAALAQASTGVFFLRVQSDSDRFTRKLVMIR